MINNFSKIINNMSLLMHWWPLMLSLVIAVIANLKMLKKCCDILERLLEWD